MAQITEKKIATFQGQSIFLYRMENPNGAYVEITNYGATLMAFVVPDIRGDLGNIVLGYDSIEEYFSDSSYVGCTIGRFANRIGGACFTLDGETYQLDKNDGVHSNHGGFNGFNTKVFDCRVEGEKLVLSCESSDGEGGFPGKMDFCVVYSFLKGNVLCVDYIAESDRKTLFSPTNHAYFNLKGGQSNVLSHELRIPLGFYLEANNEFIPTGSVQSVANTVFDFREFTQMSSLMPLKGRNICGYNTYFTDELTGEMKLLATLREMTSGRSVDVYSTMPGLQLYTGDYLNGKHSPFAGMCLEAHFYPDGPNHPDFKTCILYPGEKVKESIVFSAGVYGTGSI